MTKKHFVALAEVLHDTKASMETCNAIAEICAQISNKFDRDKFLQSCRRRIE